MAHATAGSAPPLLPDSGWITHLTGQLEPFSFGAPATFPRYAAGMIREAPW
jgi:hypothetical protein